MGIAGDLAADLAEMVVHREGIADWHDQRRRFALRGADRAKHIGRDKAEVLGGRLPVCPHTRVRLFFWPMRASSWNHTSTRTPRGCAVRTRSNCNPTVAKTPLAPSHRPAGGADAAPTNSTSAGAAAGRYSTGCNRSQT